MQNIVQHTLAVMTMLLLLVVVVVVVSVMVVGVLIEVCVGQQV